MKNIILLFIVAVSSVLMVGCAKDEEELNGKIAGLVTDYTNANTPIAGATVTLSTKGLTKTTGADGRFEFSDVTPGTYTLQIAANSYQATTKHLQQSVCYFYKCKIPVVHSNRGRHHINQNL